jgi:hypothetical protein
MKWKHSKSEPIQDLLEGVCEIFGRDAVCAYGDWDDPRSIGFRIRNVPATFSVVTTDRLPDEHYSIQIESWPPENLDYIYSAIVSLSGFLEIVRLIAGPKNHWPTMTATRTPNRA